MQPLLVPEDDGAYACQSGSDIVDTLLYMLQGTDQKVFSTSGRGPTMLMSPVQYVDQLGQLVDLGLSQEATQGISRGSFSGSVASSCQFGLSFIIVANFHMSNGRFL